METVKWLPISEEVKKPVLRLPFAEVPGAYFIVSFRNRRIDPAHLDYYIKYRDDFVPDEALISLVWAGENVCAEWEPKHGPIMTYRKCGPDWTGETLGGSPLKAKPHWFYDLVEDNPLAWSQLAVEREGLKLMMARGDFVGIFNVLKRWAQDRERSDD